MRAIIPIIKQYKSLVIFAIIIFFSSSCGNGPAPTPRPRGYPRVFFPNREYIQYTNPDCPFTFSYPSYAEIKKDTEFFGEKALNPCWFDIFVSMYNSTVYCSYYPIEGTHSFEKLRDDAFEMAYKHTTKANSIEEVPFKNAMGTGGFTFNLEGPVASSFMFYITDSTSHFIRGSLYFNTQARPDSLRPAFEFLREDLLKLIDSFDWVE